MPGDEPSASDLAVCASRLHRSIGLGVIAALVASLVSVAGSAPQRATALSGSASTAVTAPTRPETTVVTGAPPAPQACVTRTEIESWPLRDRAANLVMIGLPVTRISEATALVRSEGLGGILVRGTPRQSDAPALRALRDAGRHGRTFVAVDEEGGRVQHLKTAIGPLASARATAKTKTPGQLRALAAAHGRAMAAMGFTMNLAPDVDVEPSASATTPTPPAGAADPTPAAPSTTAPTARSTRAAADQRTRQAAIGRNGIGDRSYSPNAAVVADYGRAFALGMLDAGIVPVLKHFPGHGSASGDSHNVGASTPSLTAMRASDLVPFAKILADSRIGVMTAHLYVPGLDTQPTSLSERAITQLLRGEFGHRGLVVTDSLSMWPIRYYYQPGEAAVLALRAGNDVLLFDDRPSVPAVLSALVAAMTAEPKLAARAVDANLRVLAAKGRPVCEGPTTTPTTVIADTSLTPASTIAATTSTSSP